jgi:hypothetical protein
MSARPCTPISDEEFLWVRLFRLVDDVERAIARIERAEGPNVHAIAALERLRKDMVAALRLAGGLPDGA